MIDRFERFSYAISEISRCWHRIAAEEMEEYGLKGPYALYFTTLYRYPQGITAAQLCELCGRDKADASRAVGRLESMGLVNKENSGKNAYHALLRLTDQGKQVAIQINKKAKTAVEWASMGLSAENRAVFYEALELITANLQNLSKDGLPKHEDWRNEQ